MVWVAWRQAGTYTRSYTESKLLDNERTFFFTLFILMLMLSSRLYLSLLLTVLLRISLVLIGHILPAMALQTPLTFWKYDLETSKFLVKLVNRSYL